MMLKAPCLAPFCFGVVFYPFGSVMGATGPQSLTNAQKLSLPGNTAVGTIVHVTDGFVVSDAAIDPSFDGFYFANGTAGGKTRYLKQLPFLDDDSDVMCVYSAGIGAWRIGSGNLGTDDALTGNETNPWEADFGLVTLTHPAVQELVIADPSDESHWDVV